MADKLTDFAVLVEEFTNTANTENEKALANGNFDEALGVSAPLDSLGEIPLGQRLLKLGVSLVEEKALLEHFGAPAFENKINDQRVTNLKETRKMMKEMEKYFEGINREDIDYFLKEADCEKYGFKRKDVKAKYKFLRSEEKKQNRKVECYLEYENLDEYMGDVIPTDCLNHIEQAKSIGLKNFEIVTPFSREVNKNLLEAYPEKLPDPAVIARLGKWMVWITFWI